MKRKVKFYNNIKSFIEFILSFLLLILVIPIIMLACIAIVMEIRANPFYTQERVGLNGRIFKIYKLRSMYIDAEKDGHKWASENDDRITKVGGIIRNTRIDELPQLINILKRDLLVQDLRDQNLSRNF